MRRETFKNGRSLVALIQPFEVWHIDNSGVYWRSRGINRKGQEFYVYLDNQEHLPTDLWDPIWKTVRFVQITL